MKRIINFRYFAILIAILSFASCEKEDFTGHSKLKPTSPTITVTGVNPDGYSLVEGGQKFTFDVNLSTAQIADTKLYVKQIAGDATQGVDFAVDNSVLIPAGATTAAVTVEVFEDDLVEDTETFRIQIGDNTTANASFSPVTVDFEILNVTGDALVVDLSWATNAKDVIGLDLDATDAVDMRMLIIDVGADTILTVIDGGSFESYVFDDLPDGEYLIASDIYSTVDAGDFNGALTIDMALKFNQVGTINDMTLSFPGAMTNEFACPQYRVNLATVTKTGGSYDIQESYSYIKPPHAGQYFGKDAHYTSGGNRVDLPSHIVIDGCNDFILGLNKEWIEGFWQEKIIKEGDVSFTIEGDSIFIPNQYIFTTLYDGAEYPYSVEGKGTYDDSGTFPVINLDYTLDQDGFNPSGWCLANGYMETDYFTATVSLDPDFTFVGESSSNFSGNIEKPNRN